MKKKLSALLAALILTLTALMTGCGGIATTNKLKLSDYAVPVSEAAQQGIAASVRPKPEMIFAGNDYNRDDGTKIIFSDGTFYGMYNMETKTMALDPSMGFTDIYSLSGFYGDLDGKAYVAESQSDLSETFKAVYSEDGTLLLESGSYTSLFGSSSDKYYNDAPLAAEIKYATSGESTEEKTVYLYENEDGYLRVASGAVTSAPGIVISEVSDSKVFLPFNKSDIGEIYEQNDGFLSSYTVAMETTTTRGANVYFKTGNKVTVLKLKPNLANAIYVDGKILYSTVTDVEFDAEDGYNLIHKDGINVFNDKKQNVKTFSFDIKSGKTKELDLQYIITNYTPLYNRSSNKYDAVLVSAIKKNDGVAIYESNIDLINLIIDKDGKAGYQFEGMPVGNFDIIKLNDSRILLSNGYIVDSKGKIVSYPGRIDSIGDNFITVFDGSKYGAIDFDGKTVLPFVYDNLDFVGGGAYTAVSSIGSVSTQKLVTISNPDGIEITNALNLADGESIDTSVLDDFTYLGLIPTLKNFSDGDIKGYDFTLYSFSGEQVKTMRVVDSVDCNLVFSYNGVSLVNISYSTPMNASYENEYYIIK